LIARLFPRQQKDFLQIAAVTNQELAKPQKIVHLPKTHLRFEIQAD
jgi:hypothetical protein